MITAICVGRGRIHQPSTWNRIRKEVKYQAAVEADGQEEGKRHNLTASTHIENVRPDDLVIRNILAEAKASFIREDSNRGCFSGFVVAR